MLQDMAMYRYEAKAIEKTKVFNQDPISQLFGRDSYTHTPDYCLYYSMGK
jgi:hypothetical protein